MLNSQISSLPNRLIFLAAFLALPILSAAPNPSSIALSCTPSPSILGHPVTLTATVSPLSATGLVTFYDGVTVLGTRPIASGTATLVTSLLESGKRSLQVYYAGDTDDLPSTSAVETLGVNALTGLGYPVATTNYQASGFSAPAVADFNNDGIADLAITNPQTNTLLVLLGNGDGTFGAPSMLSTGLSPDWVVTADFNQDGNADIAEYNASSGSITMFLGHGDGTFSSSTLSFAGQAAIVADFNGDGKPDLAFASLRTLQIALGNGDGTFRPVNSYALSTTTVGTLVAADFNHDGKVDIAVGNGESNLSFFLGNGDGTLKAPLENSIPGFAGGAPTSLVVGDFNGDGNTDVASLPSLGTESVALMLGNGDGTFQAATVSSYNVEDVFVQLIKADVNGDGLSDLVISGYDRVYILLGTGNGTFQNPVEFPVIAAYPWIVSSDFNGDGRPDLAVSGGEYDILLNQPSDTRPITLVSAANPAIVNQDLLLTAIISLPAPTGSVNFYAGAENLGSATVANGTAQLTVNTLPVGTNALTATYNGNSVFISSTSMDLDETVVGAMPSEVTVTTGPNPGILGQPVTLTATVPPNATGLVTFYNADIIVGTVPVLLGQAQFKTALLLGGSAQLWAYYSGDSNYQSARSPILLQTVQSLPPNGFQPQLEYGPGFPPFFAAGDLNGDGKLDVVSVDGLGHLYIELGKGDGTFTQASSYQEGPAPVGLAIADLNDDGRQDVIALDSESNYFAVLLGNGDGTLQAPVDYRIPSMLNPTPTAFATADFNGDGKADVVVVNGGSENVAIFPGNGDGTFGQPAFYSLGDMLPYSTEGWFCSVVAGDFNADRRPDLAVSCRGATSIAILLNGPGGVFQPVQYFTPGGVLSPSIPSIVTADFNGDGELDLVTSNSSTDEFLVALGNGDGTFRSPIVIPVPWELVGGSITVGDLNGDGFIDILNSSMVLYGNGDGTFQPYQALPTQYRNQPQIMVSDVNGDGVPDLLTNSYVLLGVRAGSVSVTLTSAPNPSTFGQPVGLTATVSPASAIGTVTFADGYTVLGTAAVVNGVATLTTSAMPAGTLSLTAEYNGGVGTSSIGSSIQTVTANACSPNLSSIVVTSLASSVFLGLAPGSSCSWTASNSDAWLSLVPESGGFNIVFDANNSGADRVGSIQFQIAGQGAILIPVTQALASVVYADVPPTAYYFDAVDLLGSENITNGCSAVPLDFCPTEDITRSQMAIFIVRSVLHTDDFPYNPVPWFSDVPVGSFGFQWIQKMYELGITDGCGTKLFCPSEQVTRAQMAIFLIRMRYGAWYVFDYPSTPYFTDVTPSTLGWSWIQRMKDDNITSGCSATTYCPNNPVTRGDMAIFVMRGAFNQLLPSGDPVLVSISPTTIVPGATPVTFTITGLNTNFVNGLTTLGALPGITAGPVTVVNRTSLTVQLSAASDAALEPLSPLAITGTPPGNEEAVLPNGLMVR